MDELFKSLPSLIGVIVGGSLTGFNTWLSDRRVLVRNRNYSTVRIICVLENLISACENIVTDEGEYASGGERWPIFKNLKSIDFPIDLDWKLVEHKFVYSLLTLQNRLEDANRIILANAEIDGPPDYDEFFSSRQKQYSLFGLYLLKLRQKIMESNKIKVDLDSFLHAEDIFKKSIDKMDKRDLANSFQISSTKKDDE